MAIEVFANFVNTTLAGSIGPSSTTLTVASGAGATLPQPVAGQFGRLILADQLTGAVHEIIIYTAVSGDTVSGITRGSSPLAWSAGDIIQCGPTAQTMAEFLQAGQAQINGPTYAADTGSANAYAISPSPAISGTPSAGTRLYFKAVAANTGASTLSVNGTSYPLTGANGALAANEIVANGNVTVAWNSTYSGFELVGCTRAEVATPAPTSAGHAVNLGLFLGAAKQSLTTNGFQVFPGGLIFQWATVTATSVAGTGWATTLALPIAFPNAGLAAGGNYKSAVLIAGAFAVNASFASTSVLNVCLDAAGGGEPAGSQSAFVWAVGY